jgi:hypothetical protein
MRPAAKRSRIELRADSYEFAMLFSEAFGSRTSLWHFYEALGSYTQSYRAIDLASSICVDGASVVPP